MTHQLTLFAHIPKTAGTSVKSVAKENHDSLIAFSKRAHSGTRLHDWVADFQSRDASRGGSTFIQGHFGYGLHDYLQQPATYTTFLRRPVDRVVSHYYFLTRPESSSHWAENPPGIAELLHERRLSAFDNLQTRYISGLGWHRRGYCGDLLDPKLQVAYGECSAEMLEMAKGNLQHRMLFGLQDRYDESIAFLRSALGWKVDLPESGPLNVNPRRKRVTELDEELVEFIRAENALDVELYKFASSLFDAQVATGVPVVVEPADPESTKESEAERRRPLPPELRTSHQEARQFFAQGDFRTAAAKLTTYVTDETDHIPSLNTLAQCFERLGRIDEASLIYSRIVAIGPANVEKFRDRLNRLQSQA